jgi:thiosulfate/3-mercaptopyruvate sulfurtransferase
MANDPVIDSAALLDLGMVRLLDVREVVTFEAGHREGAIRVPIEIWEAAAKSVRPPSRRLATGNMRSQL